MIIEHSYLNDMEIPGTKRFIPEGFELGTTLSKPIRSIHMSVELITIKTSHLDSL